MNYYVYTHKFPNGTYYIGKGKGYRATHFKNRNTYWQNLFNKYGKPEVEYTITNLTNKESLHYEQICISNFKLVGLPLCNITDGGEGEGHPHTEYHKLNMQKAKNPNALIIRIYNHLNELQKTCVGTFTNITDNIPKHAFVKSYKNKGQPLGYSLQSRTELRKSMYQQYIGWYALRNDEERSVFDDIPNIDIEQNTGLYSNLNITTGSYNPNAKYIDIKDSKGNIVFTSHGNFAFMCKQYNIPKSLAEKAKRTGNPINTTKDNLQHLNGYTVTIRK